MIHGWSLLLVEKDFLMKIKPFFSGHDPERNLFWMVFRNLCRKKNSGFI